MNTPFTPPGNPFDNRGFGFGLSPDDRRAVHHRRREARRELRDQLRDHRGDAGFGPGFGGVGGFNPGGGPFTPGGGPFGPGFGFGPGGRRGGRRGGGRGRRGDVRAAILTLLVDRPMHGYEMIQEINERSQQLWKPSPGSVYPTLQLLVDEGLIVSTEADGSKKLFELTADGRAAAEKIETAPWDEIADEADPAAMGLRTALHQLMAAAGQASHAATAEQQQRIVDVLNTARREIYTVLGED